MSFHNLPVQVPLLQPDRITFKWHIYWARVSNWFVCSDALSHRGASFNILLVQVSLRQPDHINCKWRIYWTWKPDFIVCCATILHHGVSFDILPAGTSPTTRSHHFQVTHLLDLEAWLTWMQRCTVTLWREFSHTARAGLSSATRSHQFQVAISEDLGVWNHCM